MAVPLSSDVPPYCDEGYPLIIVGSGLAGHSAAAQAIKILSSKDALKKYPIIVLEKEPKFGGNSMKATSGINGAGTDFQKQQNIIDNVNAFAKDTYYSATKSKPNDNNKHQKPPNINELIKTLTHSSSSAVNWLQQEFKLELTAISRCGGHSQARTHRPPAGPAGNIIVKTIHNKIEEHVDFRYNCEALEIIMEEETKTVIGIRYHDHNDDKVKELFGTAVILTSGGFGSDHSKHNSLLDVYSTQNENKLPTTNGNWATGDGIKMGTRVGAKMIDMREIQVHPTGFINPKSPNDQTKFLAPEALRGYGGIIIDNNGKRFVNELDLRANVVDQMRANEKNIPFRLVMTDAIRNQFGKNMNFYIKFGLVKEYKNVKEMSEDIGVAMGVLSETLKGYREDSLNGFDKFGKDVFPNGDTFKVDETIYAAMITPVIHYTMGGLEINANAQILDINEEVIGGFFGAGEVTGGVHGQNRLAGNSLLECVVFGRIAAANAIQYCENVNKQKALHHSEL